MGMGAAQIPPTTKVTIQKIDANTKQLIKAEAAQTPAVLSLFAADINGARGAFLRNVTLSDGTYTFDNLPYPSTYYIQETIAPSGYIAGKNNLYKLAVDRDGTVTFGPAGDKTGQIFSSNTAGIHTVQLPNLPAPETYYPSLRLTKKILPAEKSS
ncbi:prealbumin-like fold domain-containing protein [Arcanobacterium hippocoleae]